MRILLVSNYQPPHLGGIEYAAEALKKCWERRGHAVTWMTTDIPRGARPASADNVRIRAANFIEDWWEINTPMVCPLARAEIARQVNTHDIVNVHSLAPGLSRIALRTAVRAGKPAVATQHVGVIPLKSRLLTALQNTVITRAAQYAEKNQVPLTFVGRAVRDWFVANAGLRPESTFMTPAGINSDDYYFVDEDARPRLKEKWRLDDGRMNVLFVGRFYEKKGMPILRQLAERLPDIRFTFRGSGPLNPETWELPNVVVLPMLSESELRELYGAHDLFIMPSIGEGWPAVIPQAMACGLPCLISSETFEGHGLDDHWFLVHERNVDVLTNALRDAAAGRLLLLKQRKQVSEYAAKTWNWQTTADIYLDLFAQQVNRMP